MTDNPDLKDIFYAREYMTDNPDLKDTFTTACLYKISTTKWLLKKQQLRTDGLSNDNTPCKHVVVLYFDDTKHVTVYPVITNLQTV